MRQAWEWEWEWDSIEKARLDYWREMEMHEIMYKQCLR